MVMDVLFNGRSFHSFYHLVMRYTLNILQFHLSHLSKAEEDIGVPWEDDNRRLLLCHLAGITF